MSRLPFPWEARCPTCGKARLPRHCSADKGAARDLSAIERLYESLTPAELEKPAGVVIPQAILQLRERAGRA